MSIKMSWDVETVPANYAPLECGQCGVMFFVPKHWKHDRMEGKTQEDRTFYCPNGHARVFQAGMSEADKLRRERDRLVQEKARLEEAVAAEKRRASAQFAQNTILRKKIGEGSCPCCDRSFTNLKVHMRRKHPEFKAEAAE
jgi:hypothetical protein